MKLNVKKLVLSGLFLALALVLPFFTGQIPQIGGMLCPMHLPVILCGFVCGGGWGAAVGFVAPLLRYLLFQMPPIYPTGLAMAFEMAVYGFVCGWLYLRLSGHKWRIYPALISAMVLGRVVWGIVRLILAGLSTQSFTMAAFISGALLTAIPGILLQLVLVPLLVTALERAKVMPHERRAV
ncbi:ECF transporter S component [Fournierella massiliensis]|nr:ECF transporter S component [Fournierella massiliensis]MCF2557852.1 ECF transporter S component [Fournierella massiliensis]